VSLEDVGPMIDISPRDYVANWRLYKGVVTQWCGAILTTAFGVGLTWGTNDWTWFQRFGAIYVVISTVLIVWPSHRKSYRAANFATGKVTESGGIRFDQESLAEFLLRGVDKLAIVTGLIISVGGSLIWGFADLLNALWPLKP